MYIYKLGHSPDFGVREFEFLTKKTALWHNQNWLISGEFCDTSICGSLIFGGQIEESAENLKNIGENINLINQKSHLKNLELEEKSPQNEYKDDQNDQSVEIENTNFENEEDLDKIDKKPRKLQNANNSIQNWSEENKILGQKLEINLQNELENLDDIENKNVLEILGAFLSKNPYKKIGIAILTSFDQQKAMNLAKKCGSKKINIISCLPNYGHWKSCKKWIVIIQNPIRKISQKAENDTDKNLQNLQFQKLILFEITNFCNQEYWANLDQNLTGEMSRGLMNLKLARTLVNLTDKKVILDPFCGSGRTMAAGFGLEKKFILSDIEKSCEQEVWDNLEFLENEKNGKPWKKSQNLKSENSSENSLEDNSKTKNLETQAEENLIENKLESNLNLEEDLSQNLDKVEINFETGIEVKNKQKNLLKDRKLLANLTLDAKELSKLEDQRGMENINFENMVIVTEGFLGTNFKKMPSSDQIKAEFENLEQTWIKTLSESAKLGIEEIIFCLPFYNLKEEKKENSGGNKEDKTGIKINHKKRFAEDTKLDKNYKENTKEKKDIGDKKPRLITSNLVAKSSGYQSRSQTWTPKNNQNSFNKNTNKTKSYSRFGDKTTQNGQNEKKESFDKKYEPKRDFGKFGKSSKNTNFGENEGKYEKKNFGKSQNKRGSWDYKPEEKQSKNGTRTFGNINKSGKPTSYKIKPKFEIESRERKLSNSDRYEQENKRFDPKNSDNYKTKLPNSKFQKTSTNSSFKPKNNLSNNSKTFIKTGSKFPSRTNSQNQNSRQTLENNKPSSNYSNFSKSQTWENSQKNYKNRWEDINTDSKLTNSENSKKPLQNVTQSIAQNSKYKSNYEKNESKNEVKNVSKYTKTQNFTSSQKSNFSDKFTNTNKTSTIPSKSSFDNEKKTLPKSNLESKTAINQIILPPFLDKLIANSQYEFAWENKHLLYSRDASFVGHLVIKLKLKDINKTKN